MFRIVERRRPRLRLLGFCFPDHQITRCPDHPIFGSPPCSSQDLNDLANSSRAVLVWRSRPRLRVLPFPFPSEFRAISAIT